MPPPRKRLRRLASIEVVAEEAEEEEEEGGELEVEVEVVEESDLDEIADGDGDWAGEEEGEGGEKEEKVMVTRRTTRSLRGKGSVLGGRSTNVDVVAARRRRSTRIKGGCGVKGRGKRAGAMEDGDGDGFEYGGPKRRKNSTNSSAKKETPMPMPTLELETDRPRREDSLTSTSSQPLRNHNPIPSLFGGRGITASAAAFIGSSQGTRQLSQPPSTAATAKSIIPKKTTITSKPIILSQPVVLEDLDDLIQDWNSDGVSDDEAEILATVGTQLQSSSNTGRGVRVGGVVVKKEMVVGWSSQSTQSQPAPKKHPPIFLTPQIPSSSLPSPSSSQTIEYRDLNLPWPQKHSPTTSAGLAIHKKKVEDVSDWLLRAREGRSRKRVLVLKGPAGCGKTATLEVLAKEGGWGVVEWGNLTGGGLGGGGGSDYDGGWKPGGGEGFASAFEDWLFRGGTWGCLDLISSSGVRTNHPSSQDSDPTRRKLLLLEDLPNLSHPGTLLSFRTAIRSYLSLPPSPPNSNLPPIPPLILIVSEVSEGTGSSTNMGMSVHRMLGPQILSHSLLSEIQFRKVARTLLVKCLEDVVRKEGYGGIFGKEVLEALAEQGDLRGAIGGLEMLALGREKQVMNLGKKGGAVKSVKRKKTATSTAVGKEMYVMWTFSSPLNLPTLMCIIGVLHPTQVQILQPHL